MDPTGKKNPNTLVDKMASSEEQTGQFGPKLELQPPGVFPEPMIIQPQLEHLQSIIILHGRGSFAAKFGPLLLATTATIANKTLQTAFPHARIIFPTASRNRATIYKRSYTHQWFDNWHLEEPTKRQDLIPKFLHKSVEYIHSLLRKEIEEVGAENVVLWGLSQGCATTMAALLTWDEDPFAAAVGMCGWLPFANVMVDMMMGKDSGDRFSQDSDDEDDPFAHSGDEDDDPFASDGHAALQAVNFFRDEIDMDDKNGMVFREIPVFLGHGTEDAQVKIELGQEVNECLKLLGVDVQMVEYEGLGHWYSEDMFRDIFQFLKQKLKA